MVQRNSLPMFMGTWRDVGSRCFLRKQARMRSCYRELKGRRGGKKKIRLNCNVNSSLLLAVRASSPLTTTCGSVYGHKSMGAKFTLAHARARMRIQYLASLSPLTLFLFLFPSLSVWELDCPSSDSDLLALFILCTWKL